MRKRKKLQSAKTHMKHRFFYAKVSFMSSTKINCLIKAEITVEVIAENPMFPVTGTIKWCTEHYRDCAIAETIQIDNVIEMSREDYIEFRKLGRGVNAIL